MTTVRTRRTSGRKHGSSSFILLEFACISNYDVSEQWNDREDGRADARTRTVANLAAACTASLNYLDIKMESD